MTLTPSDIAAFKERAASQICQDVAELSDRSSPEDQPEMMLVTGQELYDIAIVALDPIIETVEAEQAKNAVKISGSLTHKRNCPALVGERPEISDPDCTCGLVERIYLQTEQEMHAAWRKRAEEAEAKNEAQAKDLLLFEAVRAESRQRRELIEAQAKRIAELEHVLAPFAEHGSLFPHIAVMDEVTVSCQLHGRPEYEARVTAADFARARNALPSPPSDKGEGRTMPQCNSPECGGECLECQAPNRRELDLSMMLRRMCAMIDRQTGDTSLKVLSGNAKQLLTRWNLDGSPLRSDTAP